MPPLECTMQDAGDRLVVRLAGELTTATASTVRAALVKALAQRPDAVIADLTDLTVRQRQAVAVFTAVARQATMWPGTPLLVCTPHKGTAGLLAWGGWLPVFETVAQAMAVPPRRRTTLICDTLLPVAGTSARARDLATEACARWGLPHLLGPACLIAGELATNAAVHAGTLAAIRFSVGRRFLLISVQDGSTTEPRPDTTPPQDPGARRGLLLVDATAHRWGCHPREDGKVVWASLRLRDPLTR
ncbi:anti-anti-sigma factor [Krasilnikovia cinnamomea]|uniref:Anti-anti-sigma factor n=1 Tax=Krasilnikovia cinnamomea TaxID=349313 RepID=A0A4Q7Z822_9ACTN|nr:STAS domain-containing protein [Krasilnikovia cinnamomea]RZU46620.1 anti-anti-sigma factor [Krasilnikovia cinnamomea]